jgi:hypothetical protein
MKLYILNYLKVYSNFKKKTNTCKISVNIYKKKIDYIDMNNHLKTLEWPKNETSTVNILSEKFVDQYLSCPKPECVKNTTNEKMVKTDVPYFTYDIKEARYNKIVAYNIAKMSGAPQC